MDHETLFEQYVLPLMCGGVEKQITNAYEDGDASARLLAAVSLMAYTEFMGGVARRDFSRTDFGEKFKEFLCYIGDAYRELNDRVNVYDKFRSGLVHFFFVKGKCTVAMKNNPGPLLILGTPPAKDKVILKPVSCGIGLEDNGGYYFVVEKYYLDFKAACLRMYVERKGQGVTYDLESAGSPGKRASSDVNANPSPPAPKVQSSGGGPAIGDSG